MLNDLLAALPKHKCGLSITHNEHRNYRETAANWIADNEHCDWESEEAKQIAIDTDEIWVMHWYPETPVGFFAVAAPTLADLFRLAKGES